MSTATVDSAAPSPDETIRRTVRALRSAYDVDAKVLARHLGISRNSLYNRLNGAAPWLAAEIVGLAQFFNCEVSDFYTGNVRINATANGPGTESISGRYQDDIGGVVIDFPQLRARPDSPLPPFGEGLRHSGEHKAAS